MSPWILIPLDFQVRNRTRLYNTAAVERRCDLLLFNAKNYQHNIFKKTKKKTKKQTAIQYNTLVIGISCRLVVTKRIPTRSRGWRNCWSFVHTTHTCNSFNWWPTVIRNMISTWSLKYRSNCRQRPMKESFDRAAEALTSPPLMTYRSRRPVFSVWIPCVVC